MWAWARLQSTTEHQKVYFYRFSHVPNYPRESVFAAAGAAHGSELAHVFARKDTLPPSATAEDKRIVDIVATYWTNFAKRGDPNGPDLPEWPAFTATAPKVMKLADPVDAGELSSSERVELELQEQAGAALAETSHARIAGRQGRKWRGKSLTALSSCTRHIHTSAGAR